MTIVPTSFELSRVTSATSAQLREEDYEWANVRSDLLHCSAVTRSESGGRLLAHSDGFNREIEINPGEFVPPNQEPVVVRYSEGAVPVVDVPQLVHVAQPPVERTLI